MELADDQRSGTRINPNTYAPRSLQTDWEQQGQLPVADCVKLGLSLTESLQVLHENGCIHRDIKPANIIFVRGQPKLADIGLVTGADRSDISYVGTRGFLDEQHPWTVAGDIYSLGMVLYVISTGRHPDEFPNLPADFQSESVPPGFARLFHTIQKACASDLTRRYPSAKEMHLDLGSVYTC